MNNRVAILSDFQNALYDAGNPALLNLVDYMRCYHYPNRGENPRNSIAGYEGDPIYIQVPFRVETAVVGGIAPILGKVQIQIVAIKTGKQDFVIDQWTANVDASCKFNGQQSVNVNQSKGYISYPGDPYNSVSLTTDPADDAGTMKAFMLQYGLVLRYDYWTSILTTNVGGVTCNNDISNDIENVNNSWSNLASKGWALVVRFNAEVKGYDGIVTPFQAQTTIELPASTTGPDSGPSYGSVIEYYDTNGSPSPSIISGGKTWIRVVFNTNGVALPDPFDDYWGTIWADLFNGGPSSRRFASTEYASENDSPFSDAGVVLGSLLLAADGTPLQAANGSYLHNGTAPTINESNGNIRIATYANQVVLETIYDDSITGWGAKGNQIIFYSRIGFKVAEVLEAADGNDLLSADGQQLIK